MPDNQFITTRTPGSLTSTYDLAAHVAAENPHPQYLLYEDWVASSGEITDNMLQIHIKDPDAHGDTYVKPSALNNYYTKTEIDNNIYTKSEIDNNIYTKAEVDELLKGVGTTGITLYHDPITDADPTHAASMQAANAVYLYVREHETQFAQTATKTKHLDSEGLELYAHRVHEHSSSETWLNGFANKEHTHNWTDITNVPNFDDLYALKSHTHEGYVTHLELEMVGIYPSAVIGTSDRETDGSLIPFDFNDNTTQGNTTIDASTMTTAINGPGGLGTISGSAYLEVIETILTEDNYDVDPLVYGSRNCSQKLTVNSNVYMRTGTRASRSLSGDEEEVDLWTFTAWQLVGGATITSNISDVDSRVSVLEQNAIMFARHDFTSGSWKQNASTQLYEYTFNTNHFTSAHIYMNETGGSVLVDESVEVHIVGSTEAGDINRQVKLVAPQAFTGYIITLG